jgi:hypothetical protein
VASVRLAAVVKLFAAAFVLTCLGVSGTVTLDRAALAYVHLGDGTTRKMQVIVFPS